MKSIIFSFIALFQIQAFCQQPSYQGTEIQKQIERIGVLNNVLYFAAHPDDENTRFIAYMSKGLNVNTAYFSLTRGDGGQNLIGDEKGALLGIIRTQELLQARSVDGGTQYFSRAIDFGYSKSPEETFKHWEKDSLLADAVLVIRKFKPDVIVTRFPPDSRAGHGHHTVSAIIAAEAFDAAADPNRFPESAKKYGTWETQKLYWNESSWWNKDIANHKDEYVTLNIGAYDSQLGVSYSEIASVSRSQHQSQGFGMSIQRGDRIEYFKLIKGDSTQKDVLQNKFRAWSDLEGGKKIEKKWNAIRSKFDPLNPQKSIEDLVNLYFDIKEMPQNNYQDQKEYELKNIIAACGGLWLDFRTNSPLLIKNEEFTYHTYAISQSNYPYELQSIQISDRIQTVNKTLNNSYLEITDSMMTSSQTTTPYWLENTSSADWFNVTHRNLISQPENNPSVQATFTFKTSRGTIEYKRPLLYKWTDRVRGELYRPVNIVEPITVKFDKKVSLHNKIHLHVRGNRDTKNVKVQLQWETSSGIQKSEAQSIPQLKANQSIPISFTLDQIDSEILQLKAVVWETPQSPFKNSLIEIEYPHIPTQVVLPEAQMRFINTPIKVTRKNWGYIKGSGDEIPSALKEIGCTVTVLDPENISAESLKHYDGVIIGIRAFNKVKAMKSASPILNTYVYNGGFVLVQYNTNRGLVTEELGPYPFRLSRTRVTEEDASPKLLQRDHPILKYPNPINESDFDHWVQERGLYFAGSWDEHYTPIIGWNDTNEDMAKGSLLVTDYGKGQYVFTGISFFRQLPAGVLGAYKLFGNIISYGKDVSQDENSTNQ
ncbi:PIG-L family deacetylase [bacterium SCSIO 12643]|nr:PIG-L family deacetylase [bacterium SCSIO 12643]